MDDIRRTKELLCMNIFVWRCDVKEIDSYEVDIIL